MKSIQQRSEELRLYNMVNYNWTTSNLKSGNLECISWLNGLFFGTRIEVL
jgi:hypothetical protein